MHRQMISGSGGHDVTGKPVNNGVLAPIASTHISLDTLFKGASRHHDSSEVNLFRFHALTHIQTFLWLFSCLHELGVSAHPKKNM